MVENPYNAPTAKTLNSRKIQGRRPISVWLFLLLVAFIVSALVLGLFNLGNTAVSGGITEQTAKILSFAVVTTYISLAVALIWLAISAFKAKKWARWAGVIFILVCMLVTLSTPNNRQYTNDAEAAGAQVGRLFLFPLLFIWWAYSYGFSRRAKEYFLGISENFGRIPN